MGWAESTKPWVFGRITFFCFVLYFFNLTTVNKYPLFKQEKPWMYDDKHELTQQYSEKLILGQNVQNWTCFI